MFSELLHSATLCSAGWLGDNDNTTCKTVISALWVKCDSVQLSGVHQGNCVTMITRQHWVTLCWRPFSFFPESTQKRSCFFSSLLLVAILSSSIFLFVLSSTQHPAHLPYYTSFIPCRFILTSFFLIFLLSHLKSVHETTKLPPWWLLTFIISLPIGESQYYFG